MTNNTTMIEDRTDIEQHIQQIQDFVETVDEPDKWMILVPNEIYDAVIELLDIEGNGGNYYNDIPIAWTEERQETHIKYTSSLSDHSQTQNEGEE